MPCSCHQSKIDKPTDYTQQPDRACDICGEKHFSAALTLAEEKGYFAINRQRIIGELVAASWHIFAAPKHRSAACSYGGSTFYTSSTDAVCECADDECRYDECGAA